MLRGIGNKRFCTFDTIKLGNWLVKISSLDSQIMIHSMNLFTDEYELRVFMNDLEAFYFLERYND